MLSFYTECGQTTTPLPEGSSQHRKGALNYLIASLMIVSNTVTTTLGCAPLDGARDLESTPGISPAKAVPERTQASATAINNRFMDCSPLSLR